MKSGLKFILLPGGWYREGDLGEMWVAHGADRSNAHLMYAYYDHRCNRCFLNQRHSKGEHVRQINIHKESTR